MAIKRRKKQAAGRSDVHAVLDADVAAKLRAYAAFTGRDLGDILTEGLRPILRGFTVRIDGPKRQDGDAPGPAVGDDAEAA